MRTQSVLSLLIGGIAFETPDSAESPQPAAENTAFSLFSNYTEAMANPESMVAPYVLYFNETMRGLAVGAPVADYSVSVGPIIVPALIDRQQIVTRTGPNQVSIDEYERWASPQIGDLGRVLDRQLRDNRAISPGPHAIDRTDAGERISGPGRGAKPGAGAIKRGYCGYNQEYGSPEALKNLPQQQSKPHLKLSNSFRGALIILFIIE